MNNKCDSPQATAKEARESIFMIKWNGKYRGLMIYFHGNQSVNDKAISAFPSVETYDGILYGVLECRLKEPLSQEELEILKEYWLC